jgi:4-hydroxy-tetrahydrodipicolinate synthase
VAITPRFGFSGVYPMVYALFDGDGRLSRAAIRRQVEAIVRHGAHGVAVLGLASEVNKLSTAERHTLMSWVAEDLGGRRPLAVTVAEASIDGQVEFVRAAAGLGASWILLQPPPVRGVPEGELVRFFGAVADKATLPIGLQIAPEYLGIGMSVDGLRALARAHPNVKILKVEASAVTIARLKEATEGAFDLFNGRAGIEMTESLRAGAVGIIPGAESVDVLARIFDEMAAGRDGEADRLYADILPMLVFLMESIDTFLVYGKPLLGRRLGLSETAARPPASPASPFGLELSQRYADRLGPLA